MKAVFFLIFFLFNVFLSANGHIFVYHRFGNPDKASTNTSIKDLRSQFEYFKNNGYEVVSLEKFVEKQKSKESIPNNWVALTIDDGYKSFYTNGFPIFKEYGYPFSVFVYVEASNKKYGDFMTWEQIKDISKYDGAEIGLHSYAHKRLPSLTTEQIILDTQRAYDIFSQKMGFKPKFYAYPYGEYDDRVKNIIKSFNFDGILNQTSGSVNGFTNVDDIHRIALIGKVNLEHKLRYTTLNAKWSEPKYFPKDGVLKRVTAQVDKRLETINLYITGYGWREIVVNNGNVDEELLLPLKNSRTRIMLGAGYFDIATKLIIKKDK